MTLTRIQDKGKAKTAERRAKRLAQVRLKPGLY
jgi:hypothetical protein